MNSRKIDSIRTLKEKSKKKHWEPSSYRIIRTFSVYVTWALLHTPISANGVTILSLFAGLMGGAIFTLGTYWAWFVGIIFLWLSVILDFSDGEVARFRRESSWFGDYFEETVHSLLLIAIFGGLGFGVWRNEMTNPWPFVFAMLAMGFTMIVRNNMKLRIKAQLQYYGLKKLSEAMPDFDISEFKTSKQINKWLSVVNTIIFDLGFYFITLPIAALINRIDLFLYFYGASRSLAAFYMIYQSWKYRNALMLK